MLREEMDDILLQNGVLRLRETRRVERLPRESTLERCPENGMGLGYLLRFLNGPGGRRILSLRAIACELCQLVKKCNIQYQGPFRNTYKKCKFRLDLNFVA